MEKWPTDLTPEELADWLNQRLDGTLMGYLGMRVLEVGRDRALVELPVFPGLLTPLGYVHAGSMLSLADTAATFVAVAGPGRELAPGQLPVAVSISSQIIANIQSGVLLAESTVAHPGRTLVAVVTKITGIADGDKKLLALVNSTHYIRSAR